VRSSTRVHPLLHGVWRVAQPNSSAGNRCAVQCVARWRCSTTHPRCIKRPSRRGERHTALHPLPPVYTTAHEATICACSSEQRGGVANSTLDPRGARVIGRVSALGCFCLALHWLPLCGAHFYLTAEGMDATQAIDGGRCRAFTRGVSAAAVAVAAPHHLTRRRSARCRRRPRPLHLRCRRRECPSLSSVLLIAAVA
jgi:hypothetical protein